MLVSETSLNAANGVSSSVHQVLKYFRSIDMEAKIVAPKPLEHNYHGFTAEGIKSFKVRGFYAGVPGVNKLEKITQKYQPDIVHVASPFGPLGEQAIKAANVSVAVFQTDMSQYLSQMMNDFLRVPVSTQKIIESLAQQRINEIHGSADLTLVPSQASYDQLVNGGVDKSKIAFWKRGVDGDVYNPELKYKKSVQKLRKELSPSGRPIVGYVGRLATEKSVERLREIIDLDCEILIVGDGPSRKSVESALGSRAIFMGELHGKKLANAYGALDIFIHTGIFETFGQTIQEAQATGLPVIAPRKGGPIDLIEHGNTGLLYDPENLETMRDSLIRLLGDSALRTSIGLSARSRIEPNTWESLCRELVEIHYATAIKNAGY